MSRVDGAAAQPYCIKYMSKRPQGATFTALSISVDCPSCGESLPDPSGSLFWTPQELSQAIADQPNRTCDSCDEPFVLRQQNKASLELEFGPRGLRP